MRTAFFDFEAFFVAAAVLGPRAPAASLEPAPEVAVLARSIEAVAATPSTTADGAVGTDEASAAPPADLADFERFGVAAADAGAFRAAGALTGSALTDWLPSLLDVTAGDETVSWTGTASASDNADAGGADFDAAFLAAALPALLLAFDEALFTSLAIDGDASSGLPALLRFVYVRFAGG